MKRAVHFVGFKGEEYHSAVKVFGKPDVFHRYADERLFHGGEVADGDLVVFANGEESQRERRGRHGHSFNDSAQF